jgi:mitochondrial fission protein ELM1
MNQTRGLVRELVALAGAECFDIAACTQWQAVQWLVTGRFPPGVALPRPDFILGAGHDTHLALLAARRAYGGKAIVLGKPSLPFRFFDLCLTQRTDEPPQLPQVVLTDGVLNCVDPSDRHRQDRGLLLIGGPSGAHGWDNQAMCQQIAAVVSAHPDVEWILTNSRRSPSDLIPQLADAGLGNLTLVRHEDTSPQWVAQQLAEAGQAWVSDDSVSMVYEALTSGAAVGLLEVPVKREGRVTRGMKALEAAGWVTRFSQWANTGRLNTPPGQLHESRRCAALLCERFLLPRAA